MKFLSEILVKAGLAVDGVAKFNSTGSLAGGISAETTGRLQVNTGVANSYADLKAKLFISVNGFYAERTGNTVLGLNNTSGGREWYIASLGSSNADPGSLMFNNETDGLSPVSINNTSLKLKVDTGIRWTTISSTDSVTYTAGISVDAANRLQINTGTDGAYGSLKLNQLIATSLTGSGTRMVVADANGLLGTQAIPNVPVLSVFGRTGNVTAQSGDYTTAQVTESGNLYYTDARVRAAVSASGSLSYNSATGVFSYTTPNTDGVAEGSTNLYFTNARSRSAVSASGSLSYNSTTGVFSYTTPTTDGISEGSNNLYFTNARARSALSFVAGSGAYNSTTGVITIPTDNSQIGNSAGYITTISGIAAGGELSGTYPNPTLVTSAVTGKVLSGLNLTGGGTISATDSILTAFGKIQNQISAMVGGVMYQGTWNASTNSPSLTSSVGTKGHYYIVSVAGSTNLNGITNWNVGDWAIFNGSTWDKVDNTDAVSSVNGFTGAVSLTTAHIPESGNLYYTEGRVSANADVAANTAARHAAVTIATANGLSLSGQALSLALSSGSTTGALSSTDWNTFNNKQSQLNGTGFVRFSGTTASYITGTSGQFVKADGSLDGNAYLTTTSAASTYLPLTGGTITGTLNVSVASGFAIGPVAGVNRIQRDASSFGFYDTGNNYTSVTASSFIRSGGTSSQFLKADGSVDGTAYGTGSVTSVALSAPTGFSVSGSPVTSSGALALSFAAGYSLPTDASQTNWNTAFNKRLSSASLSASTLTLTLADATTVTASVPTFNQNTTGTAASLSAVLSSTLGGAGSVNGILKANGSGVVSAAVAGTDYVVPSALSGYVDLTTAQTVGGTKTFTSPINVTNQNINLSNAYYLAGKLTNGTNITLIGMNGSDKVSLDPNGYGTVLGGSLSGTSLSMSGSGVFTGNVGIGVTPSAWATGQTAFQIGSTGSFYNVGGGTWVGNNFYNNNTPSAIYLANGFASVYGQQNNGSHAWYTAPSGTAGNVVSFTERLNLSSTALTSYVPINGTSLSMSGIGLFNGAVDDGTNKLIVNGGVKGTKFTSSATNIFDNTGGRAIDAVSDGVLFAKNGGAHNIIFGDGNVRYYSLYTPSGAATGSIRNFTTSTDILTWTAAGAATFSSSGRFEGDLNVGAGSANYYTRVTTAYNFPYVDSYFDSYAGSSYEGRLHFRTNSNAGGMNTRLTIDNNSTARFVYRNNASEITDLQLSTEAANSKSKLSFLWYGSETAAIKFNRGGNSTGGSIEFWTQPEGGVTAERVTINSAGTLSGIAASFSGSVTAASLTITGTARFRSSGNWMEFSENVLTSLNSDGAHIRSVLSDPTVPTYSFQGDQNTGMYRIAADELGFSTNGTLRFSINSTGAASFTGTITTTASNGFTIGSLAGANRIQRDASTFGFYDNGNNYTGITASAFFESSDKTTKTLIQDNYLVADIDSVTPKLYTKNGKTELGYYAQDLVGLLDSSVTKDENGKLSLSYREVLVAKVYSLEKRVKELEERYGIQ